MNGLNAVQHVGVARCQKVEHVKMEIQGKLGVAAKQSSQIIVTHKNVQVIKSKFMIKLSILPLYL